VENDSFIQNSFTHSLRIYVFLIKEKHSKLKHILLKIGIVVKKDVKIQ